MTPQLACIGSPRPRKLKPDSVKMANTISKTALAMIMPMTLGNMWLAMM
ncbi:hypothetical protein ES703_82372 [subsurface metagenome]